MPDLGRFSPWRKPRAGRHRPLGGSSDGANGRRRNRLSELGSILGTWAQGEPMIEETLKQRFFQELEDHHDEALARAVTILRNMNWQPGINAASRREKAEQMLHDAMLLVLDGSRRWDPDRVDLVPFLGQIIRSLLSHEMESVAGRMV